MPCTDIWLVDEFMIPCLAAVVVGVSLLAKFWSIIRGKIFTIRKFDSCQCLKDNQNLISFFIKTAMSIIRTGHTEKCCVNGQCPSANLGKHRSSSWFGAQWCLHHWVRAHFKSCIYFLEAVATPSFYVQRVHATYRQNKDACQRRGTTAPPSADNLLACCVLKHDMNTDGRWKNTQMTPECAACAVVFSPSAKHSWRFLC